MAVFDTIRLISLKVLENLSGSGHRDEFFCADCERWESCGLKPSDTCLVKIEQLKRREQSRWLRNAPLQRWAASRWDSAF